MTAPTLGTWVRLADGREAQVSWLPDEDSDTVGVVTTEGEIAYVLPALMDPIPEPDGGAAHGG